MVGPFALAFWRWFLVFRGLVCGLKGFGVVRWGGMEEEVDYTSDGVNERDIFVVGGFSALDRQGTSGPLLSGRGLGVFSGHVDEVGLEVNDSARLSNTRISSPISVGLEGL